MTAVFERILEMSAMAAVVIAVVMLIRLLLRKAPRKYSYALWSVAAFRLVCPVSFEAVFSLFQFTRRVGEMEIMQSVTNPAPTVSSGYFDSAPPGTGTPVEIDPDYVFTYPITTPPAAEAPAAVSIDWMQMAAIVWLVGLAALLIYGIVSYVRLRRRMGTAVLLEGNVWQSDRVQSPFILGFLRPKIYLPFGLSDDQRRYVLAHERYHLKRLDHIVRPLSYLILAAHWFNPLVWLAYYLMARDMEMSCDEKVLSGGESVKAYSTTLLSFAANRRFPSPSPLAFGESGVKSRIQNALNWKKPRTWVTIIAVIVCIVVIVVCAANPKEPEGLTAQKTPYDWAAHLNAENVDSVQLYIPEYAPQQRTLTEAEVSALVTQLKLTPKDEFAKTPDNGAWAFPTERMITIICDGVEYVLNLGSGPMTVSGKDESVDWSGETHWYVNSDDLKQFILDLPGTEEPSTPGSSGTLAVWQADLTHDGMDEIIKLFREDSDPVIYTLTVTSGPTQLWQAKVTAGFDQEGYYLYKKDGESYLMQWAPVNAQGYYHYNYQIFSLTEGGEQVMLAENSLQFDMNTPESILALDIDALRVFGDEVNALLADASFLLVSLSNDLAIGDPANPAPLLWGTPFDDFERQQQTILSQQADREARTLAVWPLNDLTLTVLETTEEGFYLIDIYDANNYFFWNTYVDRRQGDHLFFRYEENGVQYLMELWSGGGQGVVLWDYRIFSVLPESLEVVRENSLHYNSVGVEALSEVDVEAIRAFEAEVNELLERAEYIAGVAHNEFSCRTPGNGPLVYSFTTGEVERIEELQTYWSEKERELKKAVAEQCNTYYVRNLMQPGGKGHGQFVLLDSDMDNRGATAYIVASFIEVDGDGNFMAEYGNIPMMFTFTQTDNGYELTEAWVQEKGANLNPHDDVKERFPAEAAQAVIEGTYRVPLRMSIFDTLKLPIGLALSNEVTAFAEGLEFAYSHICRAHPNAQAAEITGLEELDLAAVGLVNGSYLYRLSYRVKENGQWLDGPTGEDQVYLALYHDWSGSSVYWNGCGSITEGEIQSVYNTPEWYARYDLTMGDDPLAPYRFALTDLYTRWKENR